MMPCFDEPAIRAIFQLSIVRPTDFISLTNTELSSSRIYAKNEALILDSFAPTLKMSTYLVALSICQYEKVSAKSKSGVLVRHQKLFKTSGVFKSNYHRFPSMHPNISLMKLFILWTCRWKRLTIWKTFSKFPIRWTNWARKSLILKTINWLLFWETSLCFRPAFRSWIWRGNGKLGLDHLWREFVVVQREKVNQGTQRRCWSCGHTWNRPHGRNYA